MKQKIDYFIAGPGKDANREVSAETTLTMHDEFSDVLTGVG